MPRYTPPPPPNPAAGASGNVRQERSVLSVSDLNREVKQLLEGSVPLLWVSGEISNFAAPSSGHWYFTLKDARAQVRCAMFRGRNRSVSFPPTNGREVLIRARVSLYEGRGEFQLIAEHMEEAGFGLLMRQLEQLKAKLKAEGLFALERKRPLPALPANIGIITSPTGAAVRDMIQVLGRRYPAANIELWPVPVQGEGAAQQIADAIRKAGRLGRHDLLIVGRGGGSLEDLWAFNEEVVARALADCPTPTISAVGHETDNTIADLVADVRAPTPSAAAEIASANAATLLETTTTLSRRLERAMQQQLRHLGQRVQITGNRLRHPREQLHNRAQQLDHLELRLKAAMENQVERRRQSLSSSLRSFARVHPEQQLAIKRQQLATAMQDLQRSWKDLLARRQDRLQHAAAMLNNVSPLAVLQRGYAISRNADGQVIKSARQVTAGEQVSVTLASGGFEATVSQVHAESD